MRDPSGENGSGSDIDIHNSNVTATADVNAAGIGGCRKTKNVILNGHACPVKNLKVQTFPLDYT